MDGAIWVVKTFLVPVSEKIWPFGTRDLKSQCHFLTPNFSNFKPGVTCQKCFASLKQFSFGKVFWPASLIGSVSFTQVCCFTSVKLSTSQTKQQYLEILEWAILVVKTCAQDLAIRNTRPEESVRI